jgi:hypothetical protein
VGLDIFIEANYFRTAFYRQVVKVEKWEGRRAVETRRTDEKSWNSKVSLLVLK